MSICAASTKAGLPCKWSTFGDLDLCVSHAGAAGNPEARAELQARQRKGRKALDRNKSKRRRSRVPLSTAREIREFLEIMAAQAEASGGDVIKRVGAAVNAAKCAADLLERELEQNAEELRKLIEAHPHEARVLGLVP